jgi:hypothetical protein
VSSRRQHSIRYLSVPSFTFSSQKDIPFPRAMHDALLSEGLAEQHGWIPNSGWITFRIRSERGFDHALWLMRLSYLRYALKTATDPRKMFQLESEELHLDPRFKSLLELFIPKKEKQVPREPLPALTPTGVLDEMA